MSIIPGFNSKYGGIVFNDSYALDKRVVYDTSFGMLLKTIKDNELLLGSGVASVNDIRCVLLDTNKFICRDGSIVQF